LEEFSEIQLISYGTPKEKRATWSTFLDRYRAWVEKNRARRGNDSDVLVSHSFI